MANVLKFFIVGDDSDGSKTLKSFDAGVQSTTTSLEKMGLAAIAATAALSLKEATEFGTKIAEVSTLLDDTSSLEGMEQAVKDLAIEYGQFPDDQVEAIYSIISAGAEDATEAVMTLEAANKLAIGGVTDVAIAADGLTSALNAYGEEAGTATDVSDAMFVAMKAGKTTIGELSANLGNVAPIAAEAGVGLDELLGATAALTKTGATTSSSMNGLRQVIASVLKPTAEAQKEAEKLGISFNSTALESKGLQGFLEDLTAKTGGNKDSLTQLFGSVEALGPVFALTGSQAGAFSSIMEDMEKKSGATDVAFGKIQETGGQAFNRLAALANVAAIQVGNELLPAAADLANFFIGPVAGGVNKVEEAFFFLRSSAFAVMGGVSEAILSVIGPLAKAQVFLNEFLGVEAAEDNILSNVAEDLEMFSAAMAEGAVETFIARDAAIEHTIELRKQADAMRGISNEIDAVSQKKEEARTKDIENDGITAERKAELREQELEAIRKHEEELEEIRVEGLTEGQRFLELSTGARLSTIVKGGADTLKSVAQSNKTAFALHKALSLASATIALPNAVMQSFENGGGYPWGLIPAALMAAKGAIEIQSIQKAQYTGQAHGGLDRNIGEQTMLIRNDEMVLDPGTSNEVRQAATALAGGGSAGGGGSTLIIERLEINVSAALTGLGIDWEKTAEEKILPSLNKLFKRDILLEGVPYV